MNSVFILPDLLSLSSSTNRKKAHCWSEEGTGHSPGRWQRRYPKMSWRSCVKPSGKSVSGLPVLLVWPVNLHANQELLFSWNEIRSSQLPYHLTWKSVLKVCPVCCWHFSHDEGLVKYFGIETCLKDEATEALVQLVGLFTMNLVWTRCLLCVRANLKHLGVNSVLHFYSG